MPLLFDYLTLKLVWWLFVCVLLACAFGIINVMWMEAEEMLEPVADDD